MRQHRDAHRHFSNSSSFDQVQDAIESPVRLPHTFDELDDEIVFGMPAKGVAPWVIPLWYAAESITQFLVGSSQNISQTLVWDCDRFFRTAVDRAPREVQAEVSRLRSDFNGWSDTWKDRRPTRKRDRQWLRRGVALLGNLYQLAQLPAASPEGYVAWNFYPTEDGWAVAYVSKDELEAQGYMGLRSDQTEHGGESHEATAVDLGQEKRRRVIAIDKRTGFEVAAGNALSPEEKSRLQDGLCRLLFPQSAPTEADQMMPAAWFKSCYGIPSSRLRMAAKRGKLSASGEGKGKRYSVKGARILWPEDILDSRFEDMGASQSATSVTPRNKTQNPLSRRA